MWVLTEHECLTPRSASQQAVKVIYNYCKSSYMKYNCWSIILSQWLMTTHVSQQIFVYLRSIIHLHRSDSPVCGGCE